MHSTADAPVLIFSAMLEAAGDARAFGRTVRSNDQDKTFCSRDKMEVEFQRIGKRRYAVFVHRPGHIDLEMNPAPGYDELLPHDLVHFVVERELGLQRGIFGQLAAGGTAGTFHPFPPASRSREWSRVSRELARRGAKLLREGRSDCALSESVAQVCHQAWLARAFVNRSQTAGLDASVTQEQFDRVSHQLDELSAQWVRLQVGEALTVVWPEGDRRG